LGGTFHFQQELEISKANISEITGRILMKFKMCVSLCTTYLHTKFEANW